VGENGKWYVLAQAMRGSQQQARERFAQRAARLVRVPGPQARLPDTPVCGLPNRSARLSNVRLPASGTLELEVMIAERAPDAVHVLDRFHVMRLMNKAIDEVRRTEAKQLERDGYEPILKHSRWCPLKRQGVKLKELLQYNLQSVKGHLLREDFERFWDYASPTWAGTFLDEWGTWVIGTSLEPMKKVARTLLDHRELILNWFKPGGRLSAGTVEGFNNKAN
jgi:hypothetical protein